MEWVENFLKQVGIEGEENINEAVAVFKSDYFPKNAVPKDEYNKKSSKIDELESELGTAKEQLEQTNEQLDELSSKAENNEELKQNLEQIKSEYEQYQEQEQERLNQIKKKSATKDLLYSANADPKLSKLLLKDIDYDEVELGEDGEIANADDILNPLKEKYDTAFGEVQVTGNEPQDGETKDANSYAAKYEKAMKQGDRREAIKIKQQAYKEGQPI